MKITLTPDLVCVELLQVFIQFSVFSKFSGENLSCLRNKSMKITGLVFNTLV